MVGTSEALTAEQEQALQLHLGGASISEVADAVKVAPEEVRVWMRSEAFRRALADARLDERELAQQRLDRLKALALDTIEEGLHSKDDGLRLAAAKAALDWPSRAALNVRGARGLLWIAVAAAALIVLTAAIIGLLANEILTSRHEGAMSAGARRAHSAKAPAAWAPAPGNGATAAPTPAAPSIAGPEAVPSDTLAAEPVAPLAVPERSEPLKPLRMWRSASNDPSKVRRSVRSRGPQEVAQLAPGASNARASFQSKGPGRLGIAMNEHEF